MNRPVLLTILILVAGAGVAVYQNDIRRMVTPVGTCAAAMNKVYRNRVEFARLSGETGNKLKESKAMLDSGRRVEAEMIAPDPQRLLLPFYEKLIKLQESQADAILACP